MEVEERAASFREAHDRLRAALGQVIVGQEALVRGTLCGLLAGGHILIEGVPGLGKTLLARTLGQVVQLTFSRIQFTPDLMPADISGTNLLSEDATGRRTFEFAPGPVFANLVLADEINRATPKTQSALLEAMQEGQVSIGGQTRPLPEPYLVLATQNPIDLEGTYPLPEAQLDRFLLKLKVPFPGAGELAEVLDRTTGQEPEPPAPVLDGSAVGELRRTAREVVYVQPAVRDYAIALIVGSHPELEGAPELVREYVRFGVSPRGGQALLLAAKVEALVAGRYNVAVEDIRAVAHNALRHRVILNFEGEAAGISTDRVIDELLAVTPTPAQQAGG